MNPPSRMRAVRCAAVVAAALAASLLYIQNHAGQSLRAVESTMPAASQETAAQAVDPADEGALFPGLDGGTITALTVVSRDRSFEFHCNGAGRVSVNGQKADGEIFLTLVSQIIELPVAAHTAFSAAGEPLLTLTVSAGSIQHIARFYDNGSIGSKALIVCGTPEAPRYGQTDGWRIGTLMMTCEGTRIEDERGNETPAD